MECNSQEFGLLGKGSSTGSDDKGDIYHTLYSTLSLNDVESFITLQNKWHADKSDIVGRISTVLSQVYEELKLKNVEISPELQFAVESEIISLSFLTEINKNSKQVLRSSLDEVQKRIKMTVHFVSELVVHYTNTDKETDQEFLVIARLLCQNIHILKRKLRSTYNRLPWEEIEFVLANFIIIHTELEDNAIYKLFMTRERLLGHLNSFSENLSKMELKGADIDSKFPKQEYNDLSPRESLMKAVVTRCDQFEVLHKDFHQIKDVYSLRHIEFYIDLALAVDLEGKRELGKIVIERALQVLGENLKNTVESPHVSDSIHRALLAKAPRNVREIVTFLRDSLSHSHTLKKKMELENVKDENFFLEIQNDLKKVKAEITVILYEQKTNIVSSFLKEYVNTKNEENFKNIINSLSEADLGDLDVGDECPKEILRIKCLLADLDDLLKDKSEDELNFFKEMETLLNSYTLRKKNALFKYVRKLSHVSNMVEKLEEKYDFETICHDIDFDMEESPSFCVPELLEKIVSLVGDFSYKCDPSARYSDTEAKRVLDEVMYQLRFSAAFGATRVKGIDTFKQNLEKKDVDMDIQALAENEINALVKQIEEHLEVKESLVFKEEFDNSKIKYEAKVTLSTLFAGLTSKSVTKDNYTEGLYTRLANCLGVKKLDENFEKCDWDRCKNLVDNSRSSYQTLLKSVKNVIDSQKSVDVPKVFAEFCKSFKNKNLVTKLEGALEVIAQIRREEEEKYFKQRLKVLEEFLPVTGEMTHEFVAHYFRDKTLQAAVEMLVLDLLEALGDISELPDNTLCIDQYSPVLVGKCLRNYLAHGNILVEVLPCVPVIGVLTNAFRLVKDKTLFTKCCAKTHQIGRCITENMNDLKIRVNQSLTIVKNQNAMFLAATRGDVEMVQDTIHKGADISGRDIKNWSVLHFSVISDDVDMVKFFTDKCSTCNVKDIYGRIPLHVGAVKSTCKAVQFLVENTVVNVNDHDSKSMTPLHYASENGCQDIVLTLLSKGADVDSKTEENVTPLHVAAAKGYVEIVNILMQRKANRNAFNNNRVTPLHLAASYGHTDAVRILIKGDNVNICSKNKMMPLHFAACHGHKEVVEILLSNSAKVNARTREGVTPLHIAFGEDIVHILIKAGANVNTPTVNHYFTPLHMAASNGYVKEVIALLEAGAGVNGHKSCDWTPLHMAAQKGIGDMLNTLLQYKACVDAKGECDWTPLHLVSLKGNSSLVAPLLAKNANIDARSTNLQTPLHLASMRGRASTIQSLLDGNANTYAMDDCGKTPLHYVAGFGHADLVEILLPNTDIDVKDSDEDTPLCLAAGQGRKDVVDVLLKHGARVGASDSGKSKWTPLHYASGNGHTDIVRTLCLHRADVNAKTNQYVTPLHAAAQNGHKGVAEILLRSGANVDAETGNRSTPLHYATTKGHKELIEVLLSNKANINSETDEGITALHFSVDMGFRDVTEILLKRGALVNALFCDGSTPLHVAASSEHTDVIEVLLRNGARVNALANSNFTPLHNAAHDNRKTSLSMLLANGADPNIATKNSSTPLHMASCNGHAEIVDELLKYDVLMNVQDCVTWTPLHYAAKKGCNRIVIALVDRGAWVDVIDKIGNTPLHYAAMYGHVSVVTFLIEKGAKVDAQNKFMSTPLHSAAKNGQAFAILILLEKGAQVTAKTKDGYSPLDLAAMKGHLDAVNALLQQNIDIFAVSDHGNVLHQAVEGNNEEVVRTLLDRVKSDDERSRFVNATDCDGDNCLVPAAFEGNVHMGRLLLDSGVYIDAQNKGGLTALHFAALQNHLDFVKLLIDMKANKNAITLDGKTALDMAKEKGYTEIATILKPKLVEVFRNIMADFFKQYK